MFVGLSMLVYHYTDLVAGGSIIEDGYLKVSDRERQQGLKPSLWFSKQEIHEPSALKHYQNDSGISTFKTMQDQANMVGCVRFRYNDTDFNLHSWKEYGTLKGLARQTRRTMEKIHKKKGAKPSDWFCSFDYMKVEDMGSVEIWTDKWVEWTEENLESAMHKSEMLTMDGCEEDCCSSK